MSLLILAVEAVQSLPMDDITDPFLPDGNGTPKGLGSAANVLKFLTAILIFVGMGLAVLFIVIRIIRAVYSDRYQLRDAQTPVFAFLILGTIGAILQFVFDLWSAVVNAA